MLELIKWVALFIIWNSQRSKSVYQNLDWKAQSIIEKSAMQLRTLQRNKVNAMQLVFFILKNA